MEIKHIFSKKNERKPVLFAHVKKAFMEILKEGLCSWKKAKILSGKNHGAMNI